jgi:hypothetical protein
LIRLKAAAAAAAARACAHRPCCCARCSFFCIQERGRHWQQPPIITSPRPCCRPCCTALEAAPAANARSHAPLFGAGYTRQPATEPLPQAGDGGFVRAAARLLLPDERLPPAADNQQGCQLAAKECAARFVGLLRAVETPQRTADAADTPGSTHCQAPALAGAHHFLRPSCRRFHSAGDTAIRCCLMPQASADDSLMLNS